MLNSQEDTIAKQERVGLTRGVRQKAKGLSKGAPELYNIRSGVGLLDEAVVDRAIFDMDGGKLQSASVPNAAISSLDGVKLISNSITLSKCASSMENASGGNASLRTVGGPGSSLSSSRQDHNHSIGFKSDFSQEQRKDLLEAVHRIEAIPTEPGQTVRAADFLSVLDVVKRHIRMTIDEVDMPAEALVEFIDTGDVDEVHEWRMGHEKDYHARHMLRVDPRYRLDARDRPEMRRIAEEIGVDVDDDSKIPVTMLAAYHNRQRLHPSRSAKLLDSRSELEDHDEKVLRVRRFSEKLKNQLGERVNLERRITSDARE